MGFFNNVRQELERKRAYNKKFSAEERRSAEMLVEKKRLEDLRNQRATLQARRDTNDAIIAERKAIRELKYGGADRAVIGATKTTANKVGNVIKAFHNEAKERSRVYHSQPREVGNSPFSYENLSRGLNTQSPLLGNATKKKKKKGGNVKVIYIK